MKNNFVKTFRGELVNVAYIRSIKIKECPDFYKVVAYGERIYFAGEEFVHDDTAHYVLEKFRIYNDAEKFLDDLLEKLNS